LIGAFSLVNGPGGAIFILDPPVTQQQPGDAPASVSDGRFSKSARRIPAA